MFIDYLIETCDIKEKTITPISVGSYEKVSVWSVKLSDVPTRKDISNASTGSNSLKVSDTFNDDLFFFEASVNVSRGDLIVYDSQEFDVINVNKVLDSVGVHHLEVTARRVDHK